MLDAKQLGVAILIVVGLTASCTGRAAHAPGRVLPHSYANVPAQWELLDRVREVRAPQAMVASGHPIASEVGTRVLRSGGNAVDAAVAVGFALAVVYPRAGNIGGGGFMIIRPSSGEVFALDYREKAPGRASADMFLDSAGRIAETSLIGHLAAGVPGTVAGMAEAHSRFGSLPFEQLVAPAIRLAREGFVVSDRMAAGIESREEDLARFEASRRQFLPGGHPPTPGTLFVQSDLAATLQLIADSGPSGFYTGRTADLIVAEMERGGGLISHEDLATYRPAWRDPVTTTYRGYAVYSMPPASSGGVTLAETLNILEGIDPMPPLASTAGVHVLAEAMRRAFIDRNQYLGDPDFVGMPLDRLISKSYATSLRETIDPVRASTTPEFLPQLREGGETTHYSIVDSRGNAVSVSTTINSLYGNKVTVSGAGFLLNNEMDDFTAAPGQPNQFGLIQGEANSIRPGKRMLSAMTPTIVLDREGNLKLLLGSPGGPRIITAVTQVISNIVDHGMTLAEAVAAPRVHHQSLPDRIYYEGSGLRATTIDELRAMGHFVEQRDGSIGSVAAIIRDGANWVGVSDPRGTGSAVGY